MRFFVIQSEETPIAVVFHDYRDQTFQCRSLRESFLRAFNAACSRAGVEFVREDNVLRAVQVGPQEYDWIESILDQVCGDYWSLSDTGEIQAGEAGIDTVIQKYLAT